MALRQTRADALTPLIDEVARLIGSHGVEEGDASAPALVRVELEEHVQRVVRVYWTPFQVSVPGRSLGLHLEVAEPRVHWAEAYLSPTERSWVFCFAEREDGDIQMTHHRDYGSPLHAAQGFFNVASWFVLAATDKTWDDVVYTVAPEIEWTEHHRALGGDATSAAVQESLKKSTIVWLRWSLNGTTHTLPVWFVWDNKTSKMYVLSGERQQTISGAEHLKECTVILRWKGKNAQIAEIPANVRAIDPAGPEWDEIAEKVAEKRLNIPGLPEDTAQRWRDECVILELSLRQ